jgi:hypothetical protein
MPDLPTAEEMLHWAVDSGFQRTQVEDIQEHVRPSHRRLYRIARLTEWGEYLLYRLGIRSAIQHANTCGARDQWRALQRDLWYDAILSAQKPE